MQTETGISARPVPRYRLDGSYSLLVYLHAETVKRAGWDRNAAATPEAVAALADAQASLDGLRKYQTHPFRRVVPALPVAWRRGSVRVLDFGGSGPPVLTIPSMINGSQIMDLAPDLSPLRWLARQGFRVFQIDWGVPGPQERGFGLGDFIDHRLIPALEAVTRIGGAPAHLVGYCMGGPLMLALAQRGADKIGRIVTLGAPWDFSAFPEHSEMAERRVEIDQMLTTMSVMFGAIPPHTTQSFFALRDLSSGVAKFRRFAGVDPLSEAARRFVAVEDWLNDGIPLPPQVGRECFIDWLLGDVIREGRWAPAGHPFDPREVSAPALVVSAQRDTVVRRAVSEPLADSLVDATLLKANVGHIGMVVGDGAIRTVWQPLRDFLANGPQNTR